MEAPFDPARRRWLHGIAACGLIAVVPDCPVWAASARLPVPVLAWGKRGSAPGELNAPIGLAFGPGDRLYVTDTLNQRVQVFTREGALVRVVPMRVRPAGVAVDPSGLIYVSNWTENQIVVYSPEGGIVRSWGRTGTAPGEFRLPGGLAFGSDGALYVADSGNARIQQFAPTGELLRAWGSLGSGPGQFGGGSPSGSRFAGPQFLAVDRRGRVYATDTATFRVQRFSPIGIFEIQWANASGGPGGFGPSSAQISGPIAIGVDHQDRVWVGAANHRVQQFTAEGHFLQALGSGRPDDAPGHFHVPHGIAFDSSGDLYVADTLNFRIQRFAL